MSTMRPKSPGQIMSRLEPSFLTMITPINVQQVMSLYFSHAVYGLSLNMALPSQLLSEVTVAMGTSPTGQRLPEIDPNGPLKVLFRRICTPVSLLYWVVCYWCESKWCCCWRWMMLRTQTCSLRHTQSHLLRVYSLKNPKSCVHIRRWGSLHALEAMNARGLQNFAHSGWWSC
jgi:hypothetical protein